MVCVALLSAAQVSKEGAPVTWNLPPQQGIPVFKEPLTELDIPALMQEDNQTIGLKTQPYRFASAQAVEFSTAHNGHWRNLANGDRVWVLGMQCSNALALSVEFSHFNIPPGATVYLYNEDRTDFAGPFTNRQSRIGSTTGTVPIKGNVLFIEYFEPFSQRGKGELVVSSVSRSYRSVSIIPVLPGNDCVNTTGLTQNEWSDAVMMILTDNGQRAVTGTLVNNTKYDGTPLVISALQGVIGDPSALVFVHGVRGGCPGNQICWDRFVSGAEVLHEHGNSGLVLLRMKDSPGAYWNTYVAGWNVNDPGLGWYTSIQHAYASQQTVARSFIEPAKGEWSVFHTWEIDQWNIGNTFSGSLGSPLFNANGEMIGALVGGLNTCTQSTGDHFGSFASAWSGFKRFLDPVSTNDPMLSGFYPAFNRNPEAVSPYEDLIVFPNPATNEVRIQNVSDEAILDVSLIDLTGRICRSWGTGVPVYDLSDVSSGHYLLKIRQDSGYTIKQLIRR